MALMFRAVLLLTWKTIRKESKDHNMSQLIYNVFS